MTRSSGRTLIGTPSRSYSRELAFEGVEAVGRQDNVNPVEPLATNRRRLQSEARRVRSAGSPSRLRQPSAVQRTKPQVEILRGSGRAFDQRRSHAHHEETNTQGVQRLQELTFSRREDEVEHASIRGAAARRGEVPGTGERGTRRLRRGASPTRRYGALPATALRCAPTIRLDRQRCRSAVCRAPQHDAMLTVRRSTGLRRLSTSLHPLPRQAAPIVARHMTAVAANPAPNVVVLGGPNGAGKSTAAPSLLRVRFEWTNSSTPTRWRKASAPSDRNARPSRQAESCCEDSRSSFEPGPASHVRPLCRA